MNETEFVKAMLAAGMDSIKRKQDNTSEINKAAIEYYGAEVQENQCIEECAELIQAINKKHRGREHNIPEEIADVEICLEQLKVINNCADEVERYKTAKTERLLPEDDEYTKEHTYGAEYLRTYTPDSASTGTIADYMTQAPLLII